MSDKIKLLYFAAAKDITGKDQESIEIPSKCTLESLSNTLIDKYGPQLKEILSTSLYAIDMEYIDKKDETTTTIKPNAEVAIIPPVSVDSFYLVASSIAALIARFITYPLDTIKTRLQTNSEANRQYTLINDQQQQQLKHIGFEWKALKGFYRGIGITLLFSVPALTVYLTCYELVKAYLDVSFEVDWLHRNALLNHAISGCFAEISAGLFFTPMEVIKSQLQIMRSDVQGVSTTSLAKSIAQTEGLRGFYRGYWLTIAVFLPHTVTYFVVYEQLKVLWPPEDRTFLVYLFCSAVASALGIIVSTPLDIIKTRWQVSAQEHAYRGGPVKIAQQLWLHEGGFKAFTQGLWVRVAWGIPVTTIAMSIFETLLRVHNNI